MHECVNVVDAVNAVIANVVLRWCDCAFAQPIPALARDDIHDIHDVHDIHGLQAISLFASSVNICWRLSSHQPYCTGQDE